MLDAGQIRTLRVLLLHAPGHAKYETCAQPRTLLYLQEAMRAKGIEYECEDSLPLVRMLMCAYYPNSDCQLVGYDSNQTSGLRPFSAALLLAYLNILIFKFIL